jgi:N-acetylmuramic acid 6-phosphate etherase
VLEGLLTEQRNPASEDIDVRTTAEMLRIMNAEDRKVAGAVEAEIPQIAQAVDGIVERLSSGGRLFYVGAGTSGRLGVLDASECPPTFSVSPDLVQGIIAGGDTALRRSSEGSEDDRGAGERDLQARGFHARDVVVGIAASGRTPYVLGAVDYAKRIGALTIGLSCSPGSLLSTAAEIAITPSPGPEVVTGSTRLKAGTATKLVLNMISTAAMIRLGHVFGNLMVNVQPTNEKLKDRACRIVAAAAAVSPAEAVRLLDAAGNEVRTAIVMARLAVGRDEARRRIQAAGGRISALIRDTAG